MVEGLEPETAPNEYHHGRSPAAWAGGILVAVAVVAGVVAGLTGPNVTLLWFSGVLLVVGFVTDALLRRTGVGQS